MRKIGDEARNASAAGDDELANAHYKSMIGLMHGVAAVGMDEELAAKKKAGKK